MELRDYLTRRLHASTAQRYERDITFFFSLVPDPLHADYAQLVDVLQVLRQRYDNPRTLRRLLAAIKKYYDYLLDTGQREDHPCRHLHLRDANRGGLHLQDLFTTAELAQLLQAAPGRYRSYAVDSTRNRLILSFLIYQGVMREEVSRMELDHIRPATGTIYLPGHGPLNSRTLPLRAEQLHLFYEYEKQRPAHPSQRLFIGQGGKVLTGDAIGHLLRHYKYLFPDRLLSCRTIRMSVCRNLLASGKDLRAVQVYMGHKYPSSTERYQTSRMDSLKEAIRKHHPLG